MLPTERTQGIATGFHEGLVGYRPMRLRSFASENYCGQGLPNPTNPSPLPAIATPMAEPPLPLLAPRQVTREKDGLHMSQRAALITGGSSGVGLATAIELAGAGTSVFCRDVQSFSDEVRHHMDGLPLTCVEGDVRSAWCTAVVRRPLAFPNEGTRSTRPSLPPL